jgi:hypothetical protein
VRRAPVWMQRGGLEWLYRVKEEPRRLFRRYFVDGLPFAAGLLAWSWLRAPWSAACAGAADGPRDGTLRHGPGPARRGIRRAGGLRAGRSRPRSAPPTGTLPPWREAGSVGEGLAHLVGGDPELSPRAVGPRVAAPLALRPRGPRAARRAPRPPAPREPELSREVPP